MDGFKSQVGLSHKRGGEAVLSENKRRKSAILLLSSTRFDHLLVLYIYIYIKTPDLITKCIKGIHTAGWCVFHEKSQSDKTAVFYIREMNLDLDETLCHGNTVIYCLFVFNSNVN